MNINDYHNDYYYYERIRKNIRKYRRLANLTQQELADKIDVTMHYISQIESKKIQKYFTIIIVGRIADVLKIDIRQLLEPNENTDSKKDSSKKSKN